MLLFDSDHENSMIIVYIISILIIPIVVKNQSVQIDCQTRRVRVFALLPVSSYKF